MSGLTILIMVAAGAGERMAAGRAKAWIDIAGKPLLRRALEPAINSPDVDSIIIMIPKDELDASRKIISSWNLPKIGKILEGGARRQDTVSIALDHLPENCEIVVIHDAARPFATASLFSRVIEAARRTGAAAAAVKPVDTIVKFNESGAPEYLDRESLMAIQTPQAFRADTIIAAHRFMRGKNIEATDDASLVKMSGGKIEIVAGETSNFKITHPEDVRRAEAIIEQRGK